MCPEMKTRFPYENCSRVSGFVSGFASGIHGAKSSPDGVQPSSAPPFPAEKSSRQRYTWDNSFDSCCSTLSDKKSTTARAQITFNNKKCQSISPEYSTHLNGNPKPSEAFSNIR